MVELGFLTIYITYYETNPLSDPVTSNFGLTCKL